MSYFSRLYARSKGLQPIAGGDKSLKEVYNQATDEVSEDYFKEIESLLEIDTAECKNVVSLVARSSNPYFSENEKSVYNAMKEAPVSLDFPVEKLAFMFDGEPKAIFDEKYANAGKETPLDKMTGMPNANIFDDHEEARKAMLMEGYSNAYRQIMNSDLFDDSYAGSKDEALSIARAYYLADLVPDGGDISGDTLQKLAGPIEQHVARTADDPGVDNNAYVWKSIYDNAGYDNMINMAADRGYSPDYNAIASSEAGFRAYTVEYMAAKGWDEMTAEDFGLDMQTMNEVHKAMSTFDAKGDVRSYTDAFSSALEEFGADKDAVAEYKSRVDEFIKPFEDYTTTEPMTTSTTPPESTLWYDPRECPHNMPYYTTPTMPPTTPETLWYDPRECYPDMRSDNDEPDL